MRQLDTLLKLYRPNVQTHGNYSADTWARGGNDTLRRAIVALGLATDDEVGVHFARLDAEQNQRIETAATRAMEQEHAGA